jgi:peptidoglycan/xylan/chitin deacetylase (PgdA/CDA1 family)
LIAGIGLLAAAGLAAPAAQAYGTISSAATPEQEQSLGPLLARGLPVFCGGGRRREVALTFDDGPGPYSWRLLSELHGVPATFFLIGRDVPEYPRVVREEARLDAIGDHTQTHAVLTRLPLGAVREEIADGKRALEAAARQPVRLFRPPGDHWDLAINAVVREQGLLSVGYTVDPRDWALGTSRAVTTAVLSDPRLVPGAIVLLHETRLSTVEAVPAIVAALRRRGLEPVTVPQLLSDDPPSTAEQREDLNARSCVHLFERRSRTSPRRF